MSFTCAASGSGNLIFILSHETQGILAVSEEVGLSAEVTNSTLMVANTSIESRGVYWCNVTGEGKNIRSHSGTLTVQGEYSSAHISAAYEAHNLTCTQCQAR